MVDRSWRRFTAYGIGVAAVFAAYLLMPESAADKVAQYVTGLSAVLIGGFSLQDYGKAKNGK